MMTTNPIVYAVFTTGWIFFQDDPTTHPTRHVRSEVAGLHPSWYRYSRARKYTDNGSEPLPVMTAIRHERPWKDWTDEEQKFEGLDPGKGNHASVANAWFQCKLNKLSFLSFIHGMFTVGLGLRV